MDNKLFREQINEDIELIQEKYGYLDLGGNLKKKNEYAFNFWIITHLFSIDEELTLDHITEYSDKGVDCFVHYEENKELYIIQNKFYSADIPVQRSDVSDFLITPLTMLKEGNYKKSKELQNIFNKAIGDSEI